MANTKVTGDLIASSTIATGNIADNAVTSDKISGITTAHITEGANLYYTDARADARITAATTSDLTEGTNLYYTDARADARAALLVDSAPSTLNTLNELAAALGDDPNFATTVTNSIGLKAPIASPTFTGVPSFSLNDGTFIKAVNATNNIASTNVWGYGLYEGGSKLAEISLVRNGSNNQMYIGTTTANQVLRIGTANKVTALTIDASQNATFAGSVTLTSATSDVDLIINSGADGVNDANREEGFIRFYQNNANFFSLGKRNNGQFVLLDHTAGQDVITVQDNGAIFINPANNMMGINPVSFRSYWSGYSVFKFGADNSIFSNSASGSGSAMFIGQNVYNDGANYRYNGAASNEASLFDMRSGTLAYLNAPNGSGGAVATMTNRFNVFLNGNFNIGAKEAGGESVTGPFVVTHTSSRFLTSSYEESSVSLSAKNNNNNLETLRLAGDSIKFFNGTNAVGSQKMVILNNGNVGIGVTSPAYKLHIQDINAAIVYVKSTANNQNASIWFNSNSGGTQADRWEIGTNISAGTDLEFFDRLNSVSRMVIQNDGNVGIGTISPQTKLQTNLEITGSYLSYLNGTSATFDAQANIAVVHNSPSIGSATAAGLVLANNDKSNGAPSPIIAFSAKSASNSYNHTYAAIYGIKTASGADTNWTKGDLVLATGSGTGPSERMRILSSGGITFNGDTAAANALDDYEEGSWTPQVYYQNSTDQANATNTVSQGKYTKIGNLVFVQFRLDFSQGSSSPVNDNIGVKNLPFAGANNHYAGGGNVITSVASSNGYNLALPNAGSTIAILNNSGNVGNYGGQFGSGSNKYIRGSLIYIAQ